MFGLNHKRERERENCFLATIVRTKKMKWSENNRVKDFKDLHVLATSFCNFHDEVSLLLHIIINA